MKNWKQMLEDYIYRTTTGDDTIIEEFTAQAKDEFTQEDWDEFVEFIEAVINDLSKGDYDE